MMNKNISLIVILGCIVCIVALMITTTAVDSNLKLKKSHSFSSQKKHEGWGIDGYWSTDSDCQDKCSKVNGYSCGAAMQNCCVEKQCKEQSGWLGSSYKCYQRIPVEGCTTSQ